MKALRACAVWGCLAVTGWLTAPALAQCTPHWDLTIGTPGLGQVNDTTIWDDGTGPALYAVGVFASFGGTTYNHVAKYDGTAWVPVGGGVTTGSIVNSVAGFNGELYITGQFSAVGGVSAAYIAKWNGTEWSAAGTGLNNMGQQMVVWDDGTGPALYVAGQYSSAGGVANTARIARWDGTAWSALGTGLNSAAKSITVWDDGTGEALYVGGAFSSAGGVPASKVAKWDGSAWSALGAGISGGSSYTVYSACGYGDGIYFGGNFTSAGGSTVARIAKWDGSAWSDVGGGADGTVYALETFDDGAGLKLYAAGAFTTVGPAGEAIQVNKIATWNGAQWGLLGEYPYVGVGANAVLCLLNTGGDRLVVGGNIVTAGVNPEWLVDNILEWVGCPPIVDAACCYPDGSCAVTVEGDCSGVWHAEWASCDVAECPMPTAACCYIDGLCAETTEADCTGQWHSEWADCLVADCPVPLAACCYADASCEVTSMLDCGGLWHDEWPDCDVAQCPACGPEWDATIGQPGMEQSPPWSGATVYGLAGFNDGTGPALYAGGAFDIAAGQTVNYIARWDGSTWSGVGGGMSESGDIGVPAVLVLRTWNDGTGPALYAAGSFGRAGGVFVGGIAKWDGATWSPLGGGIAGTSWHVMALQDFDDGSGPGLFVGGDFNTVDGHFLPNLAKWDGQEWSFGGPPPDNNVTSLAVFDDGTGPALYVGGMFHYISDQAVNHIAKWDGTTWSDLELGTDTNVLCLQVFDDGSGPALYAGGMFEFAGGHNCRYIAKWNGTTWSAVGGGMNDFVQRLHVFDDGSGPALYAVGDFTEAGGQPANHIAKWDGLHWYALGSGLNDDAFSLTTFNDGSGPDLYVGGWFTAAGGQTAHSIATWRGCLVPPLGDLNCDGLVNSFDIDPFVLALTDPAGYSSMYTNCDYMNADCNQDGAVNAFDIDPFVQILTGG